MAANSFGGLVLKANTDKKKKKLTMLSMTLVV